MKVTIIGGLGYLGGRIRQYLKSLNYEVIIATRSKEKSLNSFNIVYIDYSSDINLNEICKNSDSIIYTAGMSQLDSNNNPEQSLKSVNYSFKRIFDAVNENHVNNFFYISTSQVYAENKNVINERSPTFAKDSYTKGHIVAEEYIRSKSISSNTRSTIIRLSNSFGAPINMKSNCWHLAVNNFCKNAILKNKILVQSDGKSVLNFVNISRLCKAIDHILNLRDKNNFEIYNLGNDKSYSIKAISHLISYRTELLNNKKPEIIIKNIKSKKSEINYSIDKILNTGFIEKNSNDFIFELDSLLNYCYNNILK